MDRLTQMELFVQTVELSSITRAAEKLGLSDSVASRSLSALEQRLGARLLERTTRRLWPTEAGRAYHQRCVQLLVELADADATVGQYSVRPSGVLSLTSSPSFAMMHIAPMLPEFWRLYPGLSIQILAANHYADAIESGVDIAVRTRPFEPDSGITVRKLTQARYVPAASPKYLAERGAPSTPKELECHPTLIYGFSREIQPLVFSRGDTTETVRLKPALLSSEGRVLCAAALAGGGILLQPMYTIYDDLKAGRLVPVLQDWHLPALAINLAYHSRKHQPAKIRVFIDFLLAHFAQQDYERKWNEWPPAATTAGNSASTASSGRKHAPIGAGSSDQRGTG
ncbi:LysR family transcriptional regulator [Bradyrhizobium sp. AUGA SZCCT0182]|uniref:LysR family transcriptional regulator n=1 Tax=Bradyrhizobium sp. AUGA SZCCT0182 TaxID=2807667 RepID=UPI001BA99B75|nr:LysR family transcriptional regulator [Bradyrhizobium sp. AUGA SZCCT0182]MBR1231791.1 LysR family transcriptional regulator [Bradyrhizobium sp. AUGA SZCCT0182]